MSLSKNCKSAPEDRRTSNDKGEKYRGLSTPPRKKPRGSGREDALFVVIGKVLGGGGEDGAAAVAEGDAGEAFAVAVAAEDDLVAIFQEGAGFVVG